MHKHEMSSFTCMFFNFFQQYFAVFHVYLFYILGQIISKYFLDATRNRISFLNLLFGLFNCWYIQYNRFLCVDLGSWKFVELVYYFLQVFFFFACILHCILFSINIHMQVKGYKSTHYIDLFLSFSFWYSHSFSRLSISYALSQIYFLDIWEINISFYSCYFVLLFCPLSLSHSNV